MTAYVTSLQAIALHIKHHAAIYAFEINISLENYSF